MSADKYYSILGLSKTASIAEIKKSYRKLSLKYHPDRNNNSEESKKKFQEISDAYDKLTNPDFKNTSKETAFKADNIFNGDDLFSFFRDNNLNNPGFASHINVQLNKPAAIVKNIKLSLEESYRGLMMPVEIERYIIEDNERKMEKETLYVNIPSGIDNNEIIIYRNKGNINNRGITGDIKLIISIEPHKEYKRNGLDLILIKNISLKESLCGCDFVIDHLSGKKYRITNSATNTILTPNYSKIIPNLGFKRDMHKGNLCIKFNIIFPERMEESKINILKKIL